MNNESLLSMMAIEGKFFIWLKKKKLLTLHTNVELQIFYINGHALRIDQYTHWKGLQTQEMPLAKHCNMYIKTVFIHTHTHTSIGSMMVTNY